MTVTKDRDALSRVLASGAICMLDDNNGRTSFDEQFRKFTVFTMRAAVGFDNPDYLTVNWTS